MRNPPCLAFAALILLAFGAQSTRAGGSGDKVWEGKRAPPFAARDLNGKEVRLADFAGKKVVWLNFWGLRCGPCVLEMPALQKLSVKYAPKGLVVIGVNTDGVDSAFIRKAFADRAELKKAGITFPLVTDPEFKVIDDYEMLGAPLNVMIDKRGIIRFRHEGYEAGDEVNYAKIVEKLLAE